MIPKPVLFLVVFSTYQCHLQTLRLILHYLPNVIQLVFSWMVEITRIQRNVLFQDTHLFNKSKPPYNNINMGTKLKSKSSARPFKI